MKTNIVKITTHGALGEHLGRKEWYANVNNFPMAMSAVEVMSKKKFCRYLIESEQKGIRYKILINGRDFLYDINNPPDPKNWSSITSSELWNKNPNLKTIDIVPVLEGSAELIIPIIISVIISVAIAMIMNALTPDPTLENFKERQKGSYLFGGPVNTIEEGIPVPVGYGRLIIGSAVIAASYNVEEFGADEQDDIHSERSKTTIYTA